MATAQFVQNEEQRTRYEVKLKRELGDLVLSLLADDSVEDILLNPDSSVWTKRMGQGFCCAGSIAPGQAMSAMNTIAAWRGTTVNHDRPILETELPLDGSRFEGIVPPVVAQPMFAIRLRPRRIFTLANYESSGILTDAADPLNRTRRHDLFRAGLGGLSHADVIRNAIQMKRNVLVAGATGSGKTTFLNACFDAMAQLAPHDRVICIEDTPELQCSMQNHVELRANSRVSMLDCLRACMRLKPTRIIVGEVRGAEAHALLKAWNTGHPGGIATLHANDAASGLQRLESLVAEAANAPAGEHIQRLIAEAVDVVVFIDEEPSLPAGRKVREVALVTGCRDGRYEVEYV
ncbi:MAG: Flp pilus assembly complex ATPase component TadA [Acidobacteriaceae bacterium]|nr:Flp pilus assembly complex ATPase component TadA [Acidobacteriaceae bacterium]